MLRILKNELCGDLLKNFNKAYGQNLEIEDPELKQLHYTSRWYILLKIPLHSM